jgi:hypothetical protein
VKIGNSGRRHGQAFQLLLGHRTGHGPHIPPNVVLGKRGHPGLGSFSENTRWALWKLPKKGHCLKEVARPNGKPAGLDGRVQLVDIR